MTNTTNTANNTNAMTIIRRRIDAETSVWTVNFGATTIEKLATKNNTDGHFYRATENFEVSMGIKDGSNGFIRKPDTGAEIKFSVNEYKHGKHAVRLVFNMDNGGSFVFYYGLKSNLFNDRYTNAMYKFFTNAIRKTDVFMISNAKAA